MTEDAARQSIIQAMTTRMRQKMILTLKSIQRTKDRWDLFVHPADIKAAKMRVAKGVNYRDLIKDGLRELDGIQSEWTALSDSHDDQQIAIDLMAALDVFNGESGSKFIASCRTYTKCRTAGLRSGNIPIVAKACPNKVGFWAEI
jgi:hypothetical protein